MVDPEFVKARTITLQLHDGDHLVVRPIVPEDKPLLLDGFTRLSEESRYRRFMGLKRLTERDLRYLTEIDYVDHFALIAFDIDDPGRPGVAVARYVRDRADPSSAEAAVTVVDDYHGRGIGSILLVMLGAVALENGINRFFGYVLADNRPAIDLFRALGARFRPDSPGVERMEIDIPEQLEELRKTPIYELLRAIARGEGPAFRGYRPA